MQKILFSMQVKRESNNYQQQNGTLEYPGKESVRQTYKPTIPLGLEFGELLMVLENAELYLYFSPEETKRFYKIGMLHRDYYLSHIEGELFTVRHMDENTASFYGEYFSSKDLRGINIFDFISSNWDFGIKDFFGQSIDLQGLLFSDTDSFVRDIDYIIYNNYIGELADGGFFILECKTKGVLKIDDYVRKYEFEAPYIDAYNVDKSRTTEQHISDVESTIESLIFEGQLDGFVDREQHEYRDRAMAVQKHTVVQYNVQLNFNQLVQQLGNKGVVLTSLQCSQCGDPSSIPSEGSFAKCGSCGSIIQVTDIFEKFKSLLS